MINSDELLFVVDKNNIPKKSLPRSVVHDKNFWHRTAHIWIINSQKEILCQKRSLLKDLFPGRWESFFGGHLGPGQDYLKTAIKELGEELGIKVKKQELKLYDVVKNNNAREFQAVFGFIWNGNIENLRPEEDEVAKVAWKDLKGIKKIYKSKNRNWTRMVYTVGVLDWLIKL